MAPYLFRWESSSVNRCAAGAVQSMSLRVLLLILALSGCLASPPAPEPSPAPPTSDWSSASPDGAHALEDLKEFVDLAPRRYDNQFQHDDARDWIEAHFQASGLTTARVPFVGAAQAGDDVEGQNILATIDGATNRTIVLGAHYDSAISAHGAAYDDGTGTMLMLEIARVAAMRDWNHTLVFAAFDQEEAGLVGSTHMANAMRDAGQDVFMINFDMVGINWPAKTGGQADRPINAYFGADDETALVATWQAAAHDLEYPEEATTQSTGLGTGSSDHGPFRAAGFPALWVRGALIGTYPAYHNLDTVESMTVAVGGDEAMLAAGFNAAMDLTYRFMERLDQEAAPTL